jgi:hypothetical protein
VADMGNRVDKYPNESASNWDRCILSFHFSVFVFENVRELLFFPFFLCSLYFPFLQVFIAVEMYELNYWGHIKFNQGDKDDRVCQMQR